MDLLPWQSSLWTDLRGLGDKMPHALLLHGQPGIGKTVFARHLAQSLLCETPAAGGHACGKCVSCVWFAQGSHPDFRMVRPEAVDVAEGMEAAEADGDEPVEPGEKKTRRAPSKDIRIEQVRALASFMGVGTHRGGLRVVLLYPVQSMNVYTANALLKMLEEPPPETVFVLVADGLERLLPTILSRCRKFPMAPPPVDLATQWLEEQGVKDAARLLAEQGGAPLAARAAASGAGAELSTLRDRLLRQLADPARLDVLALAEALGKTELPIVVGWLQRWMFDCLSQRLAGRIRYYPAHGERIVALAGRFDAQRALGFARQVNRERRVAEHPLNGRLFFESLLMAYVQAMRAH